MSEYEALRKDLDGIASSMSRYAAAVAVYTEVATDEIKALWKDNAELRDELHALANRVETLTRARLTEPAEVAERMVFVCRLNPGCNVSRPHIHADDGAVIFVKDAATADNQLGQRAVVRAITRSDKEPS